MVLVSFRYWAGAKAAAGLATESVTASTVTQALEAVFRRRSDPRFERVVRASTLLVDGSALRGDDLSAVLEGPVEVEVLPPFAGGAC